MEKINYSELIIYPYGKQYSDIDLITNYCSSFHKEIWSLIFVMGIVMLIKVMLLSVLNENRNIYKFVESASETIFIIGIFILFGYALVINGLYGSIGYIFKIVIPILICIIGYVLYRMGYIDSIISYFKKM